MFTELTLTKKSFLTWLMLEMLSTLLPKRLNITNSKLGRRINNSELIILSLLFINVDSKPTLLGNLRMALRNWIPMLNLKELWLRRKRKRWNLSMIKIKELVIGEVYLK
jgi:hypothetical protein